MARNPRTAAPRPGLAPRPSIHSHSAGYKAQVHRVEASRRGPSADPQTQMKGTSNSG